MGQRRVVQPQLPPSNLVLYVSDALAQDEAEVRCVDRTALPAYLVHLR